MQTPLRDYHHGITLSKSGSQEAETILILQEGSPRSGCSHSLQWAGDSKAVVIYGGGKPVGRPHSRDLALVNLLDTKTLHAVDIKPLLKERTEAERQSRHKSRSKPPA
jgi:hypothetical protein